MVAARASALDLDRLCQAARKARYALKNYREERVRAVKLYVGSHWSEEAVRHPQPVNMIDLYVTLMARNLVAKEPRVMLTTHAREHKPVVGAMQDWMNTQVQRIKLANSLQRVVYDGLFMLGVMKVALSTPADSARYGWALDSGQPYAEAIDFDDFAYDHHARSFDECTYIANRIRVPLEVAKESRIYSAQRKDLEAQPHNYFNAEGDEKVDTMGRTYAAGGAEEFEDHVELWEFFLPRHGLVLTFKSDGAGNPELCSDGEPLRGQNWIGPYCGPYHFLAYKPVPGNAMPKGPVLDLIDLQNGIGNVYRKSLDQAHQQKRVATVQGGRTQDGTRVIEANDGDMISCDSPPQVVEYGGVSKENLAFGMHLKDVFDFMAGNLSSLGGLAPQAKTLGQDRMLAENSSRTVSDMQATTVNFTASVCESLGWFWHHDPYLVMHAPYSPPGVPEVGVLRKVHPYGARDGFGRPERLRRQAGWEEIDLKVDPYSLQHQTPQGRAQQLIQFVTQLIVPLYASMQQQGVTIDFNTFLSRIGELLNMPDLPDILTISEPPNPDAGGGGGGPGEGPTKPPDTRREYIRHSLGGDGTGSRNQEVMNTMRQKSGGAQPGMGGG